MARESCVRDVSFNTTEAASGEPAAVAMSRLPSRSKSTTAAETASWPMSSNLFGDREYATPVINLNLIERLWKLFKKKTLYNQYCETFDAFRKACEAFFSNPQRYQTEMRSLLTENFTITGK